MWEALFRDRAGDLELPVVPDQGVVAVLVPRAAHLHAPHPQLNVRLALLAVSQHEAAIGEEPFPEGREPAAIPGGDLRDQERRRPEGLQETEEMEQVAAGMLEAAHAAPGRRAGGEDDGPARDPTAEGLVEAFDVGLESVHGGPRERAGTRYKGMPRRLSDAKSGALGRIRGPHRKVHRDLRPTSEQR